MTNITRTTVHWSSYNFGCDCMGWWIWLCGTAPCNWLRIWGEKWPNSQCKEVIPKKFLKMHSSLCMWWSKACTWCAICRADVGFVSHTRYSSLTIIIIALNGQLGAPNHVIPTLHWHSPVLMDIWRRNVLRQTLSASLLNWGASRRWRGRTWQNTYRLPRQPTWQSYLKNSWKWNTRRQSWRGNWVWRNQARSKSSYKVEVIRDLVCKINYSSGYCLCVIRSWQGINISI